jgi:hypothetical protein
MLLSGITFNDRPLAELDDDDFDDIEYIGRCPACGDLIDYCQGHGTIGDPRGAAILESHDNGEHRDCHPDGCDDAKLIERREYGLPIPAQNAVEAVLWADIDRARARAAVDFVAPGRYSTEQVIL